ncbi:hypothetical protein [Nocardioides mangrovicus]|nr:hypothetical protein [Nocardioides mangrovicus]
MEQDERELRILMYLEQVEGTPEQHSIQPLYVQFGQDQALITLGHLRETGQVLAPVRLGALHGLSPAGRSRLDALRQRQRGRGHRRATARDAMLRWLDERNAHSQGSRVGRDEFNESEDLAAFTAAESEAAAQWLYDRDLIDSISAAQESHILLWLTDEGVECVDSGLDAADFIARQTASVDQTTIVTGNVNNLAAAAGPGAIANLTVSTLDPDALEELARLLLQASPVLNLSKELELQIVNSLQVLTSEEEPGLVKKTIGQLYLLLQNSSSGALGGLIAAWMAARFGIS